MYWKNLFLATFLVSITASSALSAEYANAGEAQAADEYLPVEQYFGTGREFLSNTSDLEYGTANEAKSILNRAVIELKTDALQAIQKFNQHDGLFRDRDLRIFCFNEQDGKFTAHETFIGVDARTLQDKNGRPFGAEMYDKAKPDQISEVAHVSPDQGAKRIYFTKVANQVCGISVFRFNAPRNSALLE